MNILFISRSSLYTVKGGDTVQMEQTAAHLRKLGISVTIRLADDRHIDYTQYDLVHAFNITRPADLLVHQQKSGLPFVISPIYVEYGHAANSGYPPVLRRIMNSMGSQQREYLKSLGRAVLKGERIVSPQYWYLGQAGTIRRLLQHCAILLPNSESEYQRLKRDFPAAGNYRVVPNSVDSSLFHYPAQGTLRAANTVLCAARFEPRKNQLNVIRALNNTRFKVLFIGAAAPSHRAYYEQCKATAAPNIHFTDFISQQQLAGLYASAKVHLLASWFETTGLSSLEAAASGCNIVISPCGDTREYFKDDAWYCMPGNTQSILEAVERAATAALNNQLAARIRSTYSWEQTAAATLNTYQTILNR